jgi:hypothetical protein
MELIQKLLEEKRRLAQKDPEWFTRMKSDYASSGRIRAEDIYRLLGDPTKYVDLGKPRT